MDKTSSSDDFSLKKEQRNSVETMPDSCGSASDCTEDYDSKQEAFQCDAKDINRTASSEDALEKISEATQALSQMRFDDEHGRVMAGLNPTSLMSGRHNEASIEMLSQHNQRMLMQYVRNTQPMHLNNMAELQSRAEAAGVAMRRSSNSRTAYVWTGELPPRNYSHPVFSCKIFVGGVPWDITEDALLDAFNPYGECRVEWPGREARFTRSRQTPRGKVTGYVYIIFEQEKSVRALLHDCSQEFGSAGEWYFKLKARRFQTTEIRQVQVIPWVVSDATYVEEPSCRLDPKKTVFVGALHGMITANVLFSIMNELYGGVVFVGIDTDKYKYPIGSGRVTFSSHASYFRAIESAFLEIKTSKFSKKVQIDPFLEETLCMICDDAPGPYFCRDRFCFRYYCFTCWQSRHTANGPFTDHRALTRNAPRAALMPGNEIPEWMHERPYHSRSHHGQSFGGQMGCPSGPRSPTEDRFFNLAGSAPTAFGHGGLPPHSVALPSIGGIAARRNPWMGTMLRELEMPGGRNPWAEAAFASPPPLSPTGSMVYALPHELRVGTSTYGFGGINPPFP